MMEESNLRMNAFADSGQQLQDNNLRTILKRGLLYTFAIAFNRIVPAWLFRMRYYSVFLIAMDDSREAPLFKAEISWSETDDELQSVEQLTRFFRMFSSGMLKSAQAKVDDQLVGAFWCAQTQFDESELGVRVMLAKNQAWLFSAFVDKSMRGKAIFPQLLTFIDQSLNAEGATELFAAVNPVNKASMKVFEQNSETQPASVLAIRLLSMTFCLTFGRCSRDRTFVFNSRSSPIEIRF